MSQPHGTSRCRLENNNKMCLHELGFVEVDLLALTEDRERWKAVVIAVMKRGVPKMRIISVQAKEQLTFQEGRLSYINLSP